ncbi:MAG: hypothetical protein OXF02_07865 [Simkaniaceae bacterium]|nr:hypothetical protein [Simkaniaceae bacterium]
MSCCCCFRSGQGSSGSESPDKEFEAVTSSPEAPSRKAVVLKLSARLASFLSGKPLGPSALPRCLIPVITTATHAPLEKIEKRNVEVILPVTRSRFSPKRN